MKIRSVTDRVTLDLSLTPEELAIFMEALAFRVKYGKPLEDEDEALTLYQDMLYVLYLTEKELLELPTAEIAEIISQEF